MLCADVMSMHIILQYSMHNIIITNHGLGAVAHGRAAFDEGTGRIWLDNVLCTGSESRLIDCPANPLGTHNCQHYEDAGVSCAAPTTCKLILTKEDSY